MFIKLKDPYNQEFYLNLEKVGAIFDDMIFMLGNEQDRYEVDEESRNIILNYLRACGKIIE